MELREELGNLQTPILIQPNRGKDFLETEYVHVVPENSIWDNFLEKEIWIYREMIDLNKKLLDGLWDQRNH